jgi:hypothetical protein
MKSAITRQPGLKSKTSSVERRWTIYGLFHPLTLDCRYVGKTCRLLSVRLKQHLKRSKRDSHKCATWIRELAHNGLIPLIRELEANLPDWQQPEKNWITKLRASGALLLNMTNGGGGACGFTPTPETRLKISIAATLQFQSQKRREEAKAYGRRPWDNKVIKARLIAARHRTATDPQFLEAQRVAKLRLWQTKAFRDKVLNGKRGVDMSSIAKAIWQRPNYREFRRSRRLLRMKQPSCSLG